MDLSHRLYKCGRDSVLSRECCKRRRASQHRTSRTLKCRAEPEGQENQLRPTIKVNRAPRQAIKLPDEIPVEHSAAYILKSKQRRFNAEDDDEDEDFLSTTPKKEEEPFQGNALQWYLRKVDKATESGEHEPSAAARAYYKASSTPLGSSAANGIGSAAQNALKLGSNLGKEAGKAAGPVSKWALKSGLSAAGKLLSGKKSDKKP